MELFYTYINAFKKLKRAHQGGGAPHKPILLLAILDCIIQGKIQSNKIYISPELILCFKELWFKLVKTPHRLNFALPFYHMQSESFWKLICKPGYHIELTTSNSIKSLSSLDNSLLYAELDIDLFNLMSNAITNELLRLELLKLYFNETSNITADFSLFNSIESQILNDDKLEYTSRIMELTSTLSKDEIEEEIFVRGRMFKREVPRIYNYTCSISRIKIYVNTNAQMVDACHIVPFSYSNDDTIKNGICLCPNIHRAFDRGIISINDEFKVRVSKTIEENDSPFNLSQFNGLDILLPTDSNYFPSLENLSWHIQNKFIN